MKRFSNIFLTGLLTILPIVITLYIVAWLATATESSLGGLIRLALPEEHYRPGLGILAGVSLVFAVGLLARALVVRRLMEWGESLINRVPLVKVIYGSVRDFTKFLSGSKEKSFRQVVMVSLNGMDAELLGFVTREDLGDLSPAGRNGDRVAVYLPMSYQIGGYTLMVPRAWLRPTSLSVQEGMRFALTAGMITLGAEERPKGA